VSSRVFVDTLFVIAVINKRDQHHERAAKLADPLEGQPLLVTAML
jgi:predicted nucleic acid-binding protein